MLMSSGVSDAFLAVSASASSRSPTPPALATGRRLFSALLPPSSSLSSSNRHFGPRRRLGRRSSTMAARAAAQRLENVDELIDSVETFLFDCDGVIWKGDKLIDGVPGTLDMLRSKGKRLVFVTNNSTKSRKQYGKKFETLGLSVTEEEIFASSFAAAAYLKSIDFPKDKKVYVIGEDGILKELELAGYQYLGGPVGAVVVGFDRYFNYYKVQYGTLCVRENPGCLFIATNRDAVTHLTDAQEWAGGGSMVGAICGSTQREPLVVGKPSTFMMDYLANKFGILKSQICMVGDRLDTDILFGQNGGCKTLLVLSGVTSLQMLQSPSNSIQPDFYTNKISDLVTLKAAAV
ncbi:phosphoglycolate [Musa troglodytarum]|uniref:phosphoglycolate phosphatase n=1 Tax=Musa troglodytarum TaxID=320322 RepID=A0A9E7GWW6_9LILI|nr:phosphoglycolate [Musa troglodytarum]